MKIKGIVTQISNKGGTYGVEIGQGNWFNGFGEAKCNKGDQVEITYIDSPDKNDPQKIWKNITTLEVLGTTQAQSTVQENIDKGLRKKLATLCVIESAKLFQKEKVNKTDFPLLKQFAKELLKTAEEVADEDI